MAGADTIISQLLSQSQGGLKLNTKSPHKQFRKNAQTLLDFYPKFVKADVSAASNRAIREQGVVAQRGAGHFATLYDITPELRTAKDAMISRLETTGPSRLSQALEDQAFADLGQGSALSAEDVRDAQQAARGAFSSRGMGMLYGNQGAVAEVLNRNRFADERLNRRRNFALQVDAQSQNREQADRAFTSTAFGQLFDTLDPYKRVFGAYSLPGSQTNTGTAAMRLHDTNANYTLQQNQMILDDRMRRREAALGATMQREQMGAESQAGLASGALGAFGSIAGAIL